MLLSRWRRPDSGGYLPNNILKKAIDANRLDGKDSSSFLAANATATNADMLDGKDSGDFLGATDKASDADKLDGVDSTEFLRGSVHVARGASAGAGKELTTLPGSTLGPFNLTGPHTVIARFTASDQCWDSYINPASCNVGIWARNVNDSSVVKLWEGVFDTSGSSSNHYQGHAMDASAELPEGTREVYVTLQVKSASTTSQSFFGLQGWHLTAELYPS